MFFHYDAEHNSPLTTINGVEYDLADNDVIITDAVAISIKNKVLAKTKTQFDSVVYGQNPYGINTNHDEWSDDPATSYVCHCSGGSGTGEITKLVSKKLVSKNLDTICKWKVCVANASGKGKDGTGRTFIVSPNAVITQSYMVVGLFDTERRALNAEEFLNTHFAQFVVSALKGTHHMPKRVFKWLPVLDFSRSYTDEDLYAMFELTTEEIAHIEETTKNFPIFRILQEDPREHQLIQPNKRHQWHRDMKPIALPSSTSSARSTGRS